MSTSQENARIKAMSKAGFHSSWASASRHDRDMWPAPNKRRRCRCGCRGAASHVGGCNGIALTSGCEMKVRRWVKSVAQAPMPEPKP